jgi:acetyl-CoA acetyltransferase
MTDAFVLGGVRTPVGRYGGSLSHIRTDERPGTLSHKASSERPRPARGRGAREAEHDEIAPAGQRATEVMAIFGARP